MLEVDLMYVITRTLPESILVTYAGYILLSLNMEINKILKNGLLFGIIVAVIRLLPISFGIHTILSMMVCCVMLVNISKLPLIQPIMATCGILIALALSEGIYVTMANIFFKIETQDLMSQSIKSALLTMPSLLIFIIIIVSMKFVLNKFKSKINVS